VTRVWYQVRDLDHARAFYSGKLGFTETYNADEDGWAKLERGEMQIALAEGEPQPEGPVAIVDVADVKAEADELRTKQVNVGTVLELHDEVRVVDVFDPDGNRLQLVQQLRE
jgi:catechol 2,3-dioxygenase-like lactoylglutathione lyase family enzyme